METGNLAKEIHDQFLICKICFEPFSQPKSLSCLHSFCLVCLQKHVDANRGRNLRVHSRFIACPLCKVKTEIPTGGLRKLKDNFLLLNLTEVLHKDPGHSSVAATCDICTQVKSRSSKACTKCIDCNKLLCLHCVELHKNTGVTQQHCLVDIKGDNDIQCKSHPNDVVRFYCEPCDACVCVICTFTEHKNHEIASFSDVLNAKKDSLLLSLDKCTNKLNELKESVDCITNYEKCIGSIRERIRDHAVNQVRIIRQKEKTLLEQLDEMTNKSDAATFLKNKEWLKNHLDALQNTCNITNVLTKKENVTMLLLKKEIESQFSEFVSLQVSSIPTECKILPAFVPGMAELGELLFQAKSDVTCKEKEKASPDICNSSFISNSDRKVASSVDVQEIQLTTTKDQEITAKPDQASKAVMAYSHTSDVETSTVDLERIHPLLSCKITTASKVALGQVSRQNTDCRNKSENITKRNNFCDKACDPIESIAFPNNRLAITNEKTKKLVDKETLTDSKSFSSNTTNTDAVEHADKAVLTATVFKVNSATETTRIRLSDQCTETTKIITKDGETNCFLEMVDQDNQTDHILHDHRETMTDQVCLKDGYSWSEISNVKTCSTEIDQLLIRKSTKFLDSIDSGMFNINNDVKNKAEAFPFFQTNAETSANRYTNNLLESFSQLLAINKCGNEHVVTVEQASNTNNQSIYDAATQTEMEDSCQYKDCDDNPSHESAKYSYPVSSNAYTDDVLLPDGELKLKATNSMSLSEESSLRKRECVVDRCTNTARISWRCETPQDFTFDRATCTEKVVMVDKSTITQCANIKEDKITECISKLKHVTETLTPKIMLSDNSSNSDQRGGLAFFSDKEPSKFNNVLLKNKYTVENSQRSDSEVHSIHDIHSDLAQPEVTKSFNTIDKPCALSLSKHSKQTGIKMGKGALKQSISLIDSTANDEGGLTRNTFQTSVGYKENCGDNSSANSLMVESSESLFSSTELLDANTKVKQKKKSFVNKILSRKRGSKKQSVSPATSEKILPVFDHLEKTPKKPPSSFVYVRQKLCPVHHDSKVPDVDNAPP